MDESLSKLYQGVIFEHNNAPLFFEKRPDAPFIVDAYNPMCGDKFKLYLNIENQVVISATFHGYGCAVSKAATSVLMKMIQGQPQEKVLEMVNAYLAAVEAGPENPLLAPIDPETAVFTVAKNFPGRDKCAMLSFQALANYLSSL